MAKAKAIKGTIRSKIKRGDQVVFIAGKEYNRFDSEGNRVPYRGKVIEVKPREGKVKVEGAMIVKRHRKAIPQMNIEGGIFEREAWVDASNVAHIDPESGEPTRIRYEMKDGEKVRVAVKSGKEIPEPGYIKREKKEETPIEGTGTEDAAEEVEETETEDTKAEVEETEADESDEEEKEDKE